MTKVIHKLSTGKKKVTGNCNVKKRNCYRVAKAAIFGNFGNSLFRESYQLPVDAAQICTHQTKNLSKSYPQEKIR